MSIFKKNINLLIESLSLDDLDSEDIKDVLNVFFRNWLEEKKPEINQKRFAITYLWKRYYKEFIKDIDFSIDSDEDEDDYEYNYRKMDILKHLLDRQSLEIPTYHEHESLFLDVYRKNFEFLIKRLNLPDYIKLEFREDKPYQIFCNVIVDFVSMIKSDVRIPSEYNLQEDLNKLLKNYMGLPIGEAKFGNVEITVEDFVFSGYGDWIKKDFPLIKKNIKKTLGDRVRAIRGSINSKRNFWISLSMFNHGYLHSEDRKKIRIVWENSGYSENKLNIE
jgi:hypothetical protein